MNNEIISTMTEHIARDFDPLQIALLNYLLRSKI